MLKFLEMLKFTSEDQEVPRIGEGELPQNLLHVLRYGSKPAFLVF